jgi:hypothetical protein
MKPDEWGKDDSIIRCRRSTTGVPTAGTSILKCELCKAEITAAPITVEKQKLPNWHVVCNECYDKIEDDIDSNFGGTIRRGDRNLPTDVN